MQIQKLYIYPIHITQYLEIDKHIENEWKLINSFAKQIVHYSIYYNFGIVTPIQNIPLDLVFQNIQRLNDLMKLIIKIRKDIIYVMTKENQDESDSNHSMFQMFIDLQSYIQNNTFSISLLDHLATLQVSQYSIIDLLIFNHLHKCRSFHRIIGKKPPEKIKILIDWYEQIIKEFQINNYVDPLYLPRKEKRHRLNQQEQQQMNPELFRTIEDNDLNKFKTMISGGCSMYTVADRDKMLIPHVVCLYARVDFAEFLTSLNVDWECEDHDKMTPFFYAIRSYSEDMMKYLINRKINIEHQDIQCRTPFYYACSLGDLRTIKFVHSLGVNINAKTSLGRTPFSKSSFLGLFQVVEFLLKCDGIDASFADNQGRNALHNAAFGPKGGRDGKKVGTWGKDSPQIVQLLLENGMDVEAQDKDANTPLHVAASSEALESIPILVAFGGDVNKRNKWGETPLMVAAKFDHLDSSRIFVEQCNADIYALNDGLSAMEIAGKQNKPRVFEYLLQQMQIENKENVINNLLQVTKNFENNEIMRIFLQNHHCICQNYLTYLQDMKDCQNELFNNYIKCKELTSEEISQQFEHCVKKKNLNLFYMMIKNNPNYEISLRKSVIDHLLLFNDKDIVEILFNTQVNWIKYRSQQNESLLQRLIQKHKSAVMIKIVEYIHQIMNEQEINYNNKYLRQVTKQQINDLVDNQEYSLPEYAIMHKTMDIYQMLLTITHKKQHFHIPQYQVELIEQIQDKGKKIEIINNLQFTQEEEQYFINDESFLNKPYILIETQQQLLDCINDLKKYNILGIDTEQYTDKLNNINYKFICTIQISTIHQDYILDIMKLRPYKQLIQDIFNNNKVKVFHGSETDEKTLLQDLQIIVPNLYDTAKMDMLIRKHHNEYSLQKLCESELGIHLDKLYQKSDWRIRPLPMEMLTYARLDSACLLKLFPKLLQKVIALGLLDKVKETCQKRVNVQYYVKFI